MVMQVSRQSRLLAVLGLNLVLVVGLVAVGLGAHSISVLAAGGDYLADSGAIVLALAAIWLRNKSASGALGHHYSRAPAYAAMINGGLLLVVLGSVIVGAFGRLVRHSSPVHGLPVVVAGGVAAVAMVLGALILQADSVQDDDTHSDRVNMRAILLDTAADAAAAAGVMATGVIILATGGWYWLDPAIALIISVFVLYHVARLLRDAISALRTHTA